MADEKIICRIPEATLEGGKARIAMWMSSAGLKDQRRVWSLELNHDIPKTVDRKSSPSPKYENKQWRPSS